MASIFISHSSKDRDATNEIAELLRANSINSFFLDFDPEAGIPPGRSWEKELYEKLRTCRAALILCSENSMSSDWCFAEITHAKALGKAIFPVKIGICEIKSILRDEQILDLTKDRELGNMQLIRELDRVLSPRDRFLWDGVRAPYPGLVAFHQEDAAVFCGRDSETRDYIAWLNRLKRFAGPRLAVLVGVSGTGKSSLARAAIVPELRRDTTAWLPVIPFRPLDDPWRELDLALGETFACGATFTTPVAFKDLASDPADAAARMVELAHRLRASNRTGDALLLIVIDQFEELLVKSNDSTFRSFLLFWRTIADQRDSPVMVLATLRSDFLGDFQMHPLVREVPFDGKTLGPLSIEAFRELIEGPAAVCGLDLGPGLVEAMIADVQTEDSLPILAFTLRELWDARRDSHRLSL